MAEPAVLLAAAAQAGIHRLAIPTPFAVGRVNAYLIEDEPLTLIDTGPNSAKSLDELERALATHGRRVEDLGLIVVSHQHMDHLGLVDILARRSGADVAALDLLAPWMAGYATRMEADDTFGEAIMARHGIPQDVRYALGAVSRVFRAWGAPATATVALPDGGELRLRDRVLRVRHRPGHSPSDTLFHDEQSGVLFAADHLLHHISSNALITRPITGDPHAPTAAADRPKALLTYIDSMRATQRMAGVSVVLPGHGEPFEDAPGLIDRRLRFHRGRADKIAQLLAAGPRTAYELAHALWGNVAVTQAYLALSEVLGHVDMLVDEGAATEIEDDGVARFSV